MKIGKREIVCKTTKYLSIYNHSFFIATKKHPNSWYLYISINGYILEVGVLK